MEVRKLIVVSIFILFAAQGFTHELNTASEKQLCSNFALAMCIATEYQGSEVANDAIKALNGYREYGNMPIDAYTELSKAMASWSQKVYRSKSGTEIQVARCIDFQNSNTVTRIFMHHSPCSTPEAWSEPEEFQTRCP